MISLALFLLVATVKSQNYTANVTACTTQGDCSEEEVCDAGNCGLVSCTDPADCTNYPTNPICDIYCVPNCGIASAEFCLNLWGASWQYCNPTNGLCEQPNCVTDPTACEEVQICNTTTENCDLVTCTDPADCSAIPTHPICDYGYCLPNCSSQSGEFCYNTWGDAFWAYCNPSNGICEEGATCINTPTLCNSLSADHGVILTCNPTTGDCEQPPETCVDDATLCEEYEMCNTTTATCEMVPCPTGAECSSYPSLPICHSGYCLPDCDDNTTSAGFCDYMFFGDLPICNAASGECEPQTCSGNGDCSGGRICKSGICQTPTCVDDTTTEICEVYEICNTATETCEMVPCPNGDECSSYPTHPVCDSSINYCLPNCNSASAEFCDLFGENKPNCNPTSGECLGETCATNDDCTEAQICNAGYCAWVSCADPADCTGYPTHPICDIVCLPDCSSKSGEFCYNTWGWAYCNPSNGFCEEGETCVNTPTLCNSLSADVNVTLVCNTTTETCEEGEEQTTTTIEPTTTVEPTTTEGTGGDICDPNDNSNQCNDNANNCQKDKDNPNSLFGQIESGKEEEWCVWCLCKEVDGGNPLEECAYMWLNDPQLPNVWRKRFEDKGEEMKEFFMDLCIRGEWPNCKWSEVKLNDRVTGCDCEQFKCELGGVGRYNVFGIIVVVLMMVSWM